MIIKLYDIKEEVGIDFDMSLKYSDYIIVPFLLEMVKLLQSTAGDEALVTW